MKHIAYIAVILLPFLSAISSCRPISIKKGKKDNADSIKRARLINGVIANTAIFHRAVKSLCDIDKVREITDNELGVSFTLYAKSHNYSYAQMLIYATDHKGFEYAFPFMDEEIYYDANRDDYVNEKFVKTTEQHKWSIRKEAVFEQQFNYMAQSLGLTTFDKKDALNRFITFFEDSLFKANPAYTRRRELNLKDTSYLNNIMDRERYKNDTNYTPTQRDSIGADLSGIVHDLKQNSGNRYFECIQGINGFWKFKISTTDKGDRLYVKIDFMNKEGYFNMFF